MKRDERRDVPHDGDAHEALQPLHAVERVPVVVLERRIRLADPARLGEGGGREGVRVRAVVTAVLERRIRLAFLRLANFEVSLASAAALPTGTVAELTMMNSWSKATFG